MLLFLNSTVNRSQVFQEWKWTLFKKTQTLEYGHNAVSLGVIIWLLVLWFQLQYSLLMIVLYGLKCGRGGRADNWLPFGTFAVNPGWQSSHCYKNLSGTRLEREEYKIRRELAISSPGLAIRFAPCFSIDEWGGCQFLSNGGKRALGMFVMPMANGFLVGYSLSLKHCENPWPPSPPVQQFCHQ